MRLANRPPPHNQLLAKGADAPVLRLRAVERAVDHALGQDLEAHVADDREPVPGQGRGPKGGDVGDAARDGGQVWVCGGKEVQ